MINYSESCVLDTPLQLPSWMGQMPTLEEENQKIPENEKFDHNQKKGKKMIASISILHS